MANKQYRVLKRAAGEFNASPGDIVELSKGDAQPLLDDHAIEELTDAPRDVPPGQPLDGPHPVIPARPAGAADVSGNEAGTPADPRTAPANNTPAPASVPRDGDEAAKPTTKKTAAKK